MVEFSCWKQAEKQPAKPVLVLFLLWQMVGKPSAYHSPIPVWTCRGCSELLLWPWGKRGPSFCSAEPVGCSGPSGLDHSNSYTAKTGMAKAAMSTGYLYAWTKYKLLLKVALPGNNMQCVLLHKNTNPQQPAEVCFMVPEECINSVPDFQQPTLWHRTTTPLQGILLPQLDENWLSLEVWALTAVLIPTEYHLCM